MATIAKYNSFLLNQMNGNAVVDFDTDVIKVMLATSAYVPDATAHVYKSSVTNEVTGANYTAGGTALASKTVTNTTGTIVFDAADVTWAQNASGVANARYAIIYKDTGTAASSPLVAVIDFSSDRTTVTG